MKEVVNKRRERESGENAHRDPNPDRIRPRLDRVVDVLIRRLPPLDEDTAGLTMLDGVVDESGNELSNLRTVAEKDGRRSSRRLDDFDAEVAAKSAISVDLDGAVDGFGEVEGVGKEEILALLDAGKIDCWGRSVSWGENNR
jgi:hypothetical protein